MSITYPEALVIGALQGVTELFPVSSLGRSVLLPAVIGGRWARDLDVSTPESPYLAFIVGLHVATASRSSCSSGATGSASSAGSCRRCANAGSRPPTSDSPG